MLLSCGDKCLAIKWAVVTLETDPWCKLLPAEHEESNLRTIIYFFTLRLFNLEIIFRKESKNCMAESAEATIVRKMYTYLNNCNCPLSFTWKMMNQTPDRDSMVELQRDCTSSFSYLKRDWKLREKDAGWHATKRLNWVRYTQVFSKWNPQTRMHCLGLL